MTKKHIYISGPMQGMPDNNFPAFHAEAARLRALGHYVVNPAEMEQDEGATWSDYMRADLIVMLQECDVICLLEGHEDSAGAALELYVARELGFEVVKAGEVLA